jgi:hypothetical protein
MVGLLIGLSVGVGAQERGVPIPALVREAQGVLVAAYPELREGRVTWRLATTATGVEVEARQPRTPSEDVTTMAPLVVATVTVDVEGRLAMLGARGSLIDVALQKSAGARSSDADADLRAVGAKFPPGAPAAAVDTLVPPGVREVLGARLVRETMFRADGTADAPQDARTWRVELETDDPTGRPYTLVFEPVEGRLLSVVRR